MTTVSSRAAVGSRARRDDHDHERRPHEVRRALPLPGEHRVDQQLQHREHRAEDREHPQVGLRSRRSSSPPTKISASVGAAAPRRACRRRPGPRPGARLAVSARRRSSGRHRRERDDDDELRQEQHRLGQDQAAGVQARVVLVEHVAGDARCRRWRARRRPAAPDELRIASRTIGRARCSSLARPGRAARRRAHQPATTGTQSAERHAEHGGWSRWGCQAMHSVPKNSRGTPTPR